MPSSVRAAEGLSFEDTPPSTRPSSSASSSASSGVPPLRTTSMDSLPTSTGSEKVETIPTRTITATPKSNPRAMMFVKVGPAHLHKTAHEQIKKVQTVKALRKQSVREEDEPDWQEPTKTVSTAADEDGDWQANLDKWKKNRRKRNEDAIERVIEVKKFENEVSQTRRKSKTFSEMREETGKRGRRYNLVVHDDDGDDLSGLLSGGGGTSSTSSNNRLNSSSSLSSSITKESTTSKDLEQDNKDAKSDAGFCTGSDTGSDTLFPEDNISDTSSALGDKKETHDSLLDALLPPKDEEAPLSSSISNRDTTSITSSTTSSSITPDDTMQYTYDKAIQGYKDYAENAVKKISASSITSLSSSKSDTSTIKVESKTDSKYGPSSPTKTGAVNNKLNFFMKEMDKEFSKPAPKPVVTMREKSPKVDITKRRTMFEMSQSTSTINLTSIDNKLDKRRSSEMTASTGNLKNKVASFENFEQDPNKLKGITPPRDTKFREKLATFSSSSTEKDVPSSASRKRAPEKDKNFHNKLASFSSMENGEVSHKSSERSSKAPQLNTSLKSKIASFEQLDQQDQGTDFRMAESKSSREKSMSMECLNRSTTTQRKFEMKFNRGSADTLDEEVSPSSTAGGRWSSRLGSNKEEPSYRSTDSFSLSKATPEPSSSSSTSKLTYNSTYTHSTSAVKKIESPSTRSSSNGLAMFPLDINAVVDLSTASTTDPPISTSSPRSKSTSFTSTTTFESKQEQRSSNFSRSNKTASMTFSALQPHSSSSSLSKSESTDKHIYDDVVEPSTENVISSSVRSSIDSSKLQYTDDDIDEVPDRPASPPPLKTTQSSSVSSSFGSSFPAAFKSRSSYSSSAALESSTVLFEEVSSSAASNMAPPSEPPPPPPVDDDGSDDSDHQESLSLLPPPSAAAAAVSVSRHDTSSSCDVTLPTSPTPSDCPSLNPSEASESSSTRSHHRDELRKRRSDFLGTSSHSQAPTATEVDSLLLQQQRQVDKQMLEARRSLQLSTAQALSDIEQSRIKIQPPVIAPPPLGDSSKSTSRGRYTWEDRIKADTTNSNQNLNDTDDGYGYQSATTVPPVASSPSTSSFPANVTSSTPSSASTHSPSTSAFGTDQTDSTSKPPTSSSTFTSNIISNFTTLNVTTSTPCISTTSTITTTLSTTNPSISQRDKCSSQKLEELEIEMLQHDRSILSRTVSHGAAKISNGAPPAPPTTAPPEQPMDTYDDVTSNQPHYETLSSSSTGYKLNSKRDYHHQEKSSADLHPQNTDVGAVGYSGAPEKPQRTYNTCYDLSSSSAAAMPEPLPRKKMLSTPPQEEMYEPVDTASSSGCVPQQILSKQSRHALSATPRTRLTDGESWIKRKPQTNKDYSKHWLLQEAEQRRLEQRPFKSQEKSSTLPPTMLSSQSSSSTNRALDPVSRTSNTTEQHSTSRGFSRMPASSSSDHRATSHPSDPINRNSDPNAWRNQATTYQPIPPPSGSTNSSNINNNSSPSDKPLPDSIINSITQRVNSRSRPGSANNSSGRPSPYNASMTGSNSNIHHATNNNNYGATVNDEDYHDYMNADAINLQQQQHYQNFSYHHQQDSQQQHIYGNHTTKKPLTSTSSSHLESATHHQSPQSSPPHHAQQAPPSPGKGGVTTDDSQGGLVSVSGKKKCSHCGQELGRGAAMIIESLRLFYHIPCFVCCVCGVQLGNGEAGADVRVRNHALHCQNCYSNDKGMKFSEV